MKLKYKFYLVKKKPFLNPYIVFVEDRLNNFLVRSRTSLRILLFRGKGKFWGSVKNNNRLEHSEKMSIRTGFEIKEYENIDLIDHLVLYPLEQVCLLYCLTLPFKFSLFKNFVCMMNI